ncbi:hypothetical protein CS063_01805 [Sporanaerobium hydrogeniformans]|uniref:Uncharacterized protein n=1 Tax=Sporanaerobium hydrogeniformans TaxID=3072179 RepID=A0AC61DHA2_9FIRM|nr:polysaccharide deacetylase family protein [Sporanaerobium hydrogeniformans]PHV72235.1 hypothetical protein CS063_01805 [Sporanaerobium hydrogeniformans]
MSIKVQMEREVRRKNIKKALRSVVEWLLLLGIVIGISLYLLFPKTYKEPDQTYWKQQKGFSVLAYNGVTRREKEGLITREQLETHLKALKEAGYTSIGIQEIIDYYEKGKPLPEQAVCILFEDGRKDTVVFAQPLLEKYNFKAVMMTYASQFLSKDRLFLKEKDLKRLDKNSYWEIGSSGYRFAYINVKESEQTYNHYLMDYLRDGYGLAVETTQEMTERLSWDYDQLNAVYTEILGYQPRAYQIMHSNSLYAGMNEAVEKVNDQKIKEYFSIHFNREGTSYNTKQASPYDLNYCIVDEKWSAEELLLQLQEDKKVTYQE